MKLVEVAPTLVKLLFRSLCHFTSLDQFQGHFRCSNVWLNLHASYVILITCAYYLLHFNLGTLFLSVVLCAGG